VLYNGLGTHIIYLSPEQVITYLKVQTLTIKIEKKKTKNEYYPLHRHSSQALFFTPAALHVLNSLS
jgi:hypothetical protein